MILHRSIIASHIFMRAFLENVDQNQTQFLMEKASDVLMIGSIIALIFQDSPNKYFV